MTTTSKSVERVSKLFHVTLKAMKGLGEGMTEEGMLDPDLIEYYVARESRQRLVPEMKANGLSNREIARQLGVNEITVRRDLSPATNVASNATNDAPKPAISAEEELKQQRWATTVNLVEAIAVLDRDPDIAQGVAALFDKTVEEQKGLPKVTGPRLQRAAAYLTALSKVWGE